MRRIKYSLLAASLAVLTACGGGGGGSSAPVASTSTFPLTTVLVNSLQSSSNTYSISGTVSGVAVTGSGTVTRGSLNAGTFEGVTAQQRTVTATGSITVNGTTVPLNSSVTDWFDTNYLPLGESGGTDYKVVVGTPNIPATVRVNDTGVLYTFNRYRDSTKTLLRGTEVVSYVVEADTSSTALLTLIQTEKDTSNTTTSTGSAQVRITTSGGLTRIKETLLEGNTSLTITY